MTSRATLVHLLRNVTARELVSTLERDGFTYRRGKSSRRLYRHEDGRQVAVHYHRSSDTFPLGTLRKMLHDAQWTEEDARRLGLI